tara:strand:+ start:866 stop:991 length:126 start_codon:yes stop_codon:yes gene_type:complete
MPTYLRNFYYKKLVDVKNSEKKEVKKAQQQSKSKINPRFKR